MNNSWVHVAGVRDIAADRIRLFIDGTETGGLVADTTTKSLSNTLDLRFNSYDTGNGYLYDRFWLDDVRIYNRALTPEEIKQLFKTGKGI